MRSTQQFSITLPNEMAEAVRAKVAAGFWHVDLNPVHAAVLASVFARGGMYQPPHIIAQVVGPDGSDLTRPVPEQTRALAQSVGIDPDEARAVLDGDAYADAVRADEALAARLGIRGVPFFVLDRRYGVSGAQPPELLLQALETACS